jgi:hypothetical protein
MLRDHDIDNGTVETREDFTANDFRIKRLLNSVLRSAEAIRGDNITAQDIVARVRGLQHLHKEVGHDV